MLNETLKFLNIEKLAHLQGTQVVDATLGFAGHTIEILKKGVNVIGFETDPQTGKLVVGIINSARPASKKFGSFRLINSNFINLKNELDRIGVRYVNAVLFDLGASSYQLTSETRGFSFSHAQAELDMRLNPVSQNVTAAMLLNALNVKQLKEMFLKTVDFKSANKLTSYVISERTKKPFETVGDLLRIIDRLPKSMHTKINPATKIFLGLRMMVNSELENLTETLPTAFEVLKSGSRLVVITFHSGEDAIVKSFFQDLVRSGVAVNITNKPVVASVGEIERNPRSRSAKLRCIEKI